LSRIHTVAPAPENNSELSEIKQEDRLEIKKMHEKPTGGHLGMNRTYHRKKLFANWPGMKQHTEECIRRCKIWQKRNKITQNETKMSLQITTTPDVVW
jgi:hypothetical protein